MSFLFHLYSFFTLALLNIISLVSYASRVILFNILFGVFIGIRQNLLKIFLQLRVICNLWHAFRYFMFCAHKFKIGTTIILYKFMLSLMSCFDITCHSLYCIYVIFLRDACICYYVSRSWEIIPPKYL
jgi:hypothetical protein